MYLLDSNILIEHLAGRFDLTAKVLEVGLSAIHVPTIAAYELLHGARRKGSAKEYEKVTQMLSRFNLVAFDQPSAELSADVRFDLESKGQVIGPHDLMIAGIALVHGLTLVTNNVKEFSRVANLRIENWQNP